MPTKKTKKKVKKEKEFNLSADPQRLAEIAAGPFQSIEEAQTFFKGMVYTGIFMWVKDDPRTEEEETILTDTLAAMMCVII